ncbi:aminoglycoside phosphotransferase [Bifidobacterium asteroides]|uniref:phosphotransferase family protein n=1 Tax=Bifidobacterium asteroides TaxID=1684 RepID=UPI000D787199|nr:aminoglycoside phosphotransferase [Bifidobacterium asteroides]
MSERTKLTLAALASAAMPEVPMTGARDCDQLSSLDRAQGVDCAVVQDATGNVYDVWATGSEAGKRRLAARVKAAQALADAKEMAAMGFRVERILAYQPGERADSPTGTTAVAVMTHCPGRIRPLHLLTLNECTAAGTAIGAIHRVRPDFLKTHGYPAFSTAQIAAQLRGWIKRLRMDGHVPKEITDSWASIVATDGLWSFETCTVHGGFSDGDLLYSGSGLSGVYGWQDMQVNDPARDLAWIFAKLDGSRRNAVIAAYGRMMGARLDDLIMLRANLWLQMEQVGEFITALDHADNERIIQFKAQVERLAQQLGDHEQDRRARRQQQTPSPSPAGAPSTITVGTLLGDDKAEDPPAAKVHENQAPEPDPASTEALDESSATIAISRVEMADLALAQTAMDHSEAVNKPIGQDRTTDLDSDDKSKPPAVAPIAQGEESGLSDHFRGIGHPATSDEDANGEANPKATTSGSSVGLSGDGQPTAASQPHDASSAQALASDQAETIVLPRKPLPEQTPTLTADGQASASPPETGSPQEEHQGDA